MRQQQQTQEECIKKEQKWLSKMKLFLSERNASCVIHVYVVRFHTSYVHIFVRLSLMQPREACINCACMCNYMGLLWRKKKLNIVMHINFAWKNIVKDILCTFYAMQQNSESLRRHHRIYYGLLRCLTS